MIYTARFPQIENMGVFAGKYSLEMFWSWPGAQSHNLGHAQRAGLQEKPKDEDTAAEDVSASEDQATMHQMLWS